MLSSFLANGEVGFPTNRGSKIQLTIKTLSLNLRKGVAVECISSPSFHAQHLQFKFGKAHFCLVALMRLQLRGGKRKNEAGCIWIQLETISALFPAKARPTRIAAVVFRPSLAYANVCQHLDPGEKHSGVGQ